MIRTPTKPQPLRDRSAADAASAGTRWPAMSVDALFENEATLACSLAGRIRFCSTAARTLLGRNCADVLDHPIAELIPALPLRLNTPGYNAAYVAFWFGRNRWQAHEVLDGNGRRVAMEITIEPAVLSGEACFVIALRRLAQQQPPQALAEPRNRSDARAAYQTSRIGY